jgi:hypothetical protein
MRDFAKRLIAYEANGNKSSGIRTAGSFHFCEKVRPHLATLMGKAGFRALLSRALAMANEEAIWLHAVHVKADGSLEGLEELAKQVTPDEFLEGGVVLLAQLLGLLEVFIGENLTLQMVREIWPELSVKNFDFGKGIK